MKKIGKSIKRIFTCILAACLIAGAMPAIGMEDIGAFFAHAAEGYVIDNGYIKVTVSEKNGGFSIRTVDGDKVNKDDNDKQLLFEYDDDNTSFTSFQVNKNGETKEYIFGGKYAGSSNVSVTKENETLVAKWSVDDLTFTQTIGLINSGANEHGTAYISYTVENAGEPADVKCRMLMDTSLGDQDYAYYNIGNSNHLQEREITLSSDGYNKTFYALDDAGYPSVVAYTINAAINDVECKPYQTTFAHWNNLASTVFDYTADENMTFTNPYNKDYQTADSAYALYFDMGNVATNKSSVIGTNYGIFSNENVDTEATVAMNMVAPDALEFATDASGKEDQSHYTDDGKFTVKTYIENFGLRNYSKVKVLVYTTGGIDPLNQSGNKTNSTYDNPYFIEISDFDAKEKIEYEWSFAAEPKDAGQYAKIHYKVYDVSDEATQNTGTIMKENLLGEGATYILCPGSVNKIPAIKFTGTTPDTIYNAGIRTLYLTGDNFSMLENQSEYKLMLSRVDGNSFNGVSGIEIPAENVSIDSSANRMTVILTDDVPGTLPTGMYEFTIDYTDASKEDITAPALRFQVSDSILYRNDAYGFLAVIKTDNNEYYIKNYAKESDYIYDITTQALDRDDVLLEFKGSFIKEKQQDGVDTIVYNGLSISNSDNIMTLNDCLDIKNGTVTITEDNGSVTVDFDADIYTTGAGTSVWSGVCALTELEAGVGYALIEYDENGNRGAVSAETIALLWPSVGQGFQELMGLLFEFKYGEFGTIKNEESNVNDQRVVAFGAALDLSFIIPDAAKCKTTTTEMDNTWSLVMQESIDASPDMIRATNRRYKYNADTVNTRATTTTEISTGSDFTETGTSMGDDATAGDGDTRSASVQIDDILFGGEYIGINMSIALGIPGYIESMPGMQAILSVNTIGDWSFGASGVCEFSTFCMEASIQILSKDGIPIPDELTFFIGGFVPGINVDGYGILWLQGGGGGIQNLYDTIFLDSGIPPLKLLLEAQISLMQIISARASIGLSLRGVDASISNGVLVNALPVLNNASVSLQWYPEFYFEGAVNVSIMDAIKGGGYIVVEHDGFFEFFIRAALQIPGSIPIIGGIQIADANLGANQDKVWGQIVVLDVCLGVTYYWGKEIDWASGSPVYPTYPELVGMEGGYALASYPIGVDETTGDTLYMAVGTNLSQTAAAVAVDNHNITMYDGGGVADELYTNVLGTGHRMSMVSNGNSKFLVVEWTAETKEDALRQARLVAINDTNATPYTITMLDNTKALEEQQGSNANLTYDEENKKASLAISFTKAAAFDKVWEITTPVAASLVLYDVAPLPALSEENTTVAVNNSQVSVTLNGSGIDKFTKVSFIAENGDNATMLTCKEGTFANNDTVNFALPGSLASGTYSLRIIAKDDNDLYYSEITKEFSYTNPNQPSVPGISEVKGVGDYKLSVTMSTSDVADDFDGYVFDAYKYNAKSQTYELVNGVNNVLYYKDGSSLSYNKDGTVQPCTGNSTTEPFVIGGRYESKYTDPETGSEQTLIAGFSEGDYKLEVRRFKVVDNGKGLLYSNPYSEAVTVVKPIETKVSVSAVATDSTICKKITRTLGDGTTYEQDYYNSNELALVLSSSTEKITGQWKLDGGTREGTSGAISELTQQSNLYFTDLTDGTHTLEFVGKNEYGDKTAATYRFTVDTQGPRLMLERPLNGSLFDYKTGNVVIAGVSDKDAILTVIDNDTNETIIDRVPMSEAGAVSAETIPMNQNGNFTTTVAVDTNVVKHNLTIKVEDNLGNTTEKDVLVVSDALGSIEKLMIYAGDEDVTNTKLTAGGNYSLRLMAKPKEADSPVEINDSALVEWNYIAVNGDAEILESAADAVILKTGEDSEGMVTARYLINDAGAYTVSSSFGDTGADVIALNSNNTQIVVANRCTYTGGAITPAVTVYYNGIQLVAGVDYNVTYSNNINVSTGSSVKPQVTITGLNAYTGSVSKTFEIVYMDTTGAGNSQTNNGGTENGSVQYYTPSGIKGNNGYYTSDVTIVPENGYELVNDAGEKLSSEIMITKEGKNTVSFRTRRISDGAMSDKITLEIRIDKSLPTGTLEMNKKKWDTFLSNVTFGLYNEENYSVTIEADDGFSGIEKIEYAISGEAYAGINELEAAGLKWKKYSDTFKPTLEKDKQQIIYVRLTDRAGNVSYISSDGIVVDTIAPAISNVYIKEDTNLATDSLEFSFVSSEAGTFYYAVVKAGEKAPDANSIMEGTVENARMGSGMIPPDMVGKEIFIAVTGLEEDTLYVVYVVVEDNVINLGDGSSLANVSEVVSSTPVSTKAPEVSDETEVPENEANVGSTIVIGIVILILVVLLGGIFIFFFIKKRKKKEEGTEN